MAKRRTISEVKDLIGRSIRPGDVVAIAVSSGQKISGASQNLVLLTEIYLDDANGDPYENGVYFRSLSGLFYRMPSDINPDPRVNPPIPVPVGDLYAPKLAQNRLGSGYGGTDDVLAVQGYRLVGRLINAKGFATDGARLITYQTSNAVRVLTSSELNTLRNDSLYSD